MAKRSNSISIEVQAIMYYQGSSVPAVWTAPESSQSVQVEKTELAALIVAHPDDEVLWAGGFVLTQPNYQWHILALTRASDPDRAPRYYQALNEIGAEGSLGDLDDGPEQKPLPITTVQHTILSLLPGRDFALILTHGPQGEYTRHRRHEEVSAAVRELWCARYLKARQLWMFAYEDGQGGYLPQAAANAPIQSRLPEAIWQEKYRLITETYGFATESWEARVTPKVEAFWRFTSPYDLEGFDT